MPLSKPHLMPNNSLREEHEELVICSLETAGLTHLTHFSNVKGKRLAGVSCLAAEARRQREQLAFPEFDGGKDVHRFPTGQL